LAFFNAEYLKRSSPKMLNVIRKTLFPSLSIFKSLKHAKSIAFGTVFVMKTFWSFGFVSFGIVSNFVLRV